MTDDATLLRRYAEEKSEAAFAELVRRHLDLVYSAALRQVGDAHRAQDVAQIVFTTLARKAASLVAHPVLAGWLYTATQHAAAKAVRTEIRRRAREQEAHAMNKTLAPDATTVGWSQVRPVLDDAMRELSEADRDAVLLRFFAQRPFAEVGAALHLSEDAARMRVERALDKLHSLLAKRGVTSTATALGVALAHQAVAAAPTGLAATVAGSALASVGAVAPMFSFFQIMSTTKAVTGVAILAIGWAVFETGQINAARERVVALSEQRDQLQRRIAALETQAHDPAARLTSATTPQTAAGPTPSVPPVAAGVAGAPGPAISSSVLQPSNPLGSLYALRASADAMETWLKAERSGLDLQLGPLFASLGLPAEKMERLKDILMEKFQVIADITATAQAQGLALSDPAIRASLKEATDKAESNLHALLGDPGYEELRRYGATTEIRDLVKSLAGDVYYGTAPLNSSQAERLVQLIASRTAPGSSGYKLDSTDWPSVLAEAPGFMSAPQIAMLQAEKNQLLLRQQLDRMAKSAKAPGH